MDYYFFILILYYSITIVYCQETNSISDELDSQKTIVLRLEPQPKRLKFINQAVEPPRAVSKDNQNLSFNEQNQQQKMLQPQIQKKTEQVILNK